MTIKIEAITTCIGYADFLAETVKYNASFFDRWIIITSPNDENTREVCRKYSLECLLTEDHCLKKGEFNKGRIVDRGLMHLSKEGWRLHIDADIIIPPKFKHGLLSAELQEDNLYGVDRIMVRSYEDWVKLQRSGWLSHSYHCLTKFPAGFEIGARWADHSYGYVPIGFFQLWHSTSDQWRGIRHRTYPKDHGSACRTDVQWGLKFDRSKRELLPEILVVHLESQKSPNGINWGGRKSPPFKDGEHCS